MGERSCLEALTLSLQEVGEWFELNVPLGGGGVKMRAKIRSSIRTTTAPHAMAKRKRRPRGGKVRERAYCVQSIMVSCRCSLAMV